MSAGMTMTPLATTVITGEQPVPSLALEHIREREALNALAAEWQELLDASPLESVFLTWDWQSAWLDYYLDPRDEPWVLALREQGQLIGIAPFLRQIEKRRGRPAIRRIRFLGTGEPETEEVVSEMLDIISRPGRETDVAAAVARYLFDHSAEWDELFFQDVRGDSLINQLLVPLFREKELHVALASEWVDYRTGLPTSLDDFINGHSKKRRSLFRRTLRQYVEENGEFLALSGAKDVESYYRELIRLHNARWHSLGKPGIFTTERVVAFHDRVIRRMLDAKRLHLSLLRVGEGIVSANYIFHYKGVSQQYQGGLDTGFDRIRSPGTTHTLLCIDYDIQAGCHTLDFLKARAGVDSYKKYFGCVETPLFDITIFSNNAGGRMLRLLHVLRQLAQRVKQRLRRRRDETAPAGNVPAPEKSS